jgi:hypothetical protein
MYIDPEQQQGFVERLRMEQQQNIVRRLRNLPQEIRQPYDWTEFRRRARAQARAGERQRLNEAKRVAIAAALILIVVGVAAWLRMTRSSTSVLIETVAHAPGIESTESREAFAAGELNERAALAERWLASLPREPVVVHVGTRAAVTGLEDRIAQLDDVLSAARVEGTQPAKLVALEAQRVRLVNSLVQVRYAETLVAESR